MIPYPGYVFCRVELGEVGEHNVSNPHGSPKILGYLCSTHSIYSHQSSSNVETDLAALIFVSSSLDSETKKKKASGKYTNRCMSLEHVY